MSDVVQKSSKTKSIALAMILNATPLVIFGLGYVYIGKWIRFMVVEFLQLFILISYRAWGMEFNGYFLGLLWVASIIDVMIQTSNHNQRVLKPI